MGVLILGVNTLYRLFCFFKLFLMVGKGLIKARTELGELRCESALGHECTERCTAQDLNFLALFACVGNAQSFDQMMGLVRKTPE